MTDRPPMYRRWLDRAARKFDALLLKARTSDSRRFLHDVVLPRWARQFSDGQLVYDIGKSPLWDYAAHFRCALVSVDRDRRTGADMVLDMERPIPPEVRRADGIMFNGVFEQCADPFRARAGIDSLLAPGGTVLFGLAGPGMAQYDETDKWRVTRDGARAYASSFEILEFHELSTYFFIIARKRIP